MMTAEKEEEEVGARITGLRVAWIWRFVMRQRRRRQMRRRNQLAAAANSARPPETVESRRANTPSPRLTTEVVQSKADRDAARIADGTELTVLTAVDSQPPAVVQTSQMVQKESTRKRHSSSSSSSSKAITVRQHRGN